LTKHGVDVNLRSEKLSTQLLRVLTRGDLMDDRKRRVLLAIIQDYILTAEPVGSRTISRKYDIGVSPATIRNEMADLEEMGYIEQPHTSAGRIPSDKGYRYYVDFLMERLRLSEEEESFIYQYYDRKIAELEEVIRITSELISKLTSYAAITLGPLSGSSTIKLIDLTSIDEERALLVVVTDTGLVEHRFVDVPGYISPRDMDMVSRVLRQKLRGLTLNEISKTLFDEIRLEVKLQKDFLFDILDLIDQVLQGEDCRNIYMDGALNIMKHPEFKSIEKVQSLLGLLQEKEVIRSLMTQPMPEGLTVRIGGENIYEGIHDCSLITATYSLDNQIVGTVGVLGPTRMEYSKAISIVECITQVLSEVLSKYY
jgi:heat-inducible transcriptional repressor